MHADGHCRGSRTDDDGFRFFMTQPAELETGAGGSSAERAESLIRADETMRREPPSERALPKKIEKDADTTDAEYGFYCIARQTTPCKRFLLN